MSLPTLSTLNTTQDTNKQLANIRSYLIQLKDELEAELSNVTYDMLSASLQKRIDAISEDVAAHNGDLDIIAQTVTANYLTANEIVATYATIESLSAYMITADYVEAGVIKADVISTDIARAEQLSAYMLTADYIEGGVIKSTYIDSSYITTSTLQSRISSLNYVSMQSVGCDSYLVNYGGKGYELKPMQIPTSGGQLVVLGAAYTG